MGLNDTNFSEKSNSKKYELNAFGGFIKRKIKEQIRNNIINFEEINNIIDNSLQNFTKKDYKNNKFEISNKVISDLEKYAKENNLIKEFNQILGEHQKEVFKTILSGKEIFSGEEQIIDLKDDTNDYVEKVLKDTFSNAYKFKMGLNRLQSFIDSIEKDGLKY